MEIKRRIALIRLANKISNKMDYSQKIGVSVVNNKKIKKKVA